MVRLIWGFFLLVLTSVVGFIIREIYTRYRDEIHRALRLATLAPRAKGCWRFLRAAWLLIAVFLLALVALICQFLDAPRLSVASIAVAASLLILLLATMPTQLIRFKLLVLESD